MYYLLDEELHFTKKTYLYLVPKIDLASKVYRVLDFITKSILPSTASLIVFVLSFKTLALKRACINI